MSHTVSTAPTSGRNTDETRSAYLTGLGETAGILFDGSARASCERKMNLDPDLVRRALMKAVPDRANWQETAATPLIIEDMMERAACKVGR